jgi:hypothetical protein
MGDDNRSTKERIMVRVQKIRVTVMLLWFEAGMIASVSNSDRI